MKKLLLLLLLIPIKIQAIDTSATSSILMDINTNRILHEKNINEVRSVASISKIMTAIVAIENTDIDKKITIGNEIDGAYGSGIYIKKGEVLTIKDLLYGLMLRSGNDAALAISYHTSGSVDKFVSKMNEKAKYIGMKSTTFRNPSGLDDKGGNTSTAYDMALLMSYAYKNDVFRSITGTKEYKLSTNKNDYLWTNKNKLLKRKSYITGGKTGFTDIARRTLVTTAFKNNLNLVAVTLNDGNDWEDHINLFEYGFKNYTNYKLVDKGIINVYDDIYYQDYDLYTKEAFYYPLTSEEIKNIVLKFELEKKRIIEEGSVVGKVKVYLSDIELKSVDIYVKEKEEKKKSNFKKLIEWFKKIW